MSFERKLFKPICCFVVSLLMVGLMTANRAMGYDFTFWGSGSIAHDEDLIRAELDEDPFILYFHIEESEWCQKMNNDYLAVPEVEDFLRNFIKVEIDPDRGQDEEAVASKYNITDYPAFLVFVPAFQNEPSRIRPFSKGPSMTTDGFIRAIIEKVIYPYHKEGYSYYEKKEYDKAIKYFKRTLDYNPEYVPAYQAIGVLYHTMGREQKNLEFMNMAEEHLLKALEIDPKNQEVRKELEAVQKNIEVLKRK